MTNLTGCQYFTDPKGVNAGVTVTDADGVVHSFLLEAPEVQEFLASGGQPLPAK